MNTPEPCSALPAVTVEPLRKPFVPVLDLTVTADNDEHRAQILSLLRSADGCVLVRDLHNPRFGRNQLVSALWLDDGTIPDNALPDLMHRRLCPRSMLP